LPVILVNAGQGNALPSGAHYNLNLIGMAKAKNVDPDSITSEGHRIFVALNGNTRINLSEGDFAVLDYDGTDGKASFRLPCPDANEAADDQTTYSDYTVYLRLRGKPGGDIRMQTVGIDDQGIEYGSDYSVIQARATGKGSNKFIDVSEELLYIYAWVYNWETLTWEYLRLPLFDDRLESYLWDIDNNGVRLVQLRFYEGVQTPIDPVAPTDPPTEPPLTN
jgi:hypothetical protein